MKFCRHKNNKCTEVFPAFLSETRLHNLVIKIHQNSLISTNFLFICFAQYCNFSREEIPGQLYMYMYPTFNPGLCQRTFLELPDCEFICKIQCINIDTDCPTILISLGFSQFCLKILNPNQYKIGMGKIPILTSVLTFQIFS